MIRVWFLVWTSLNLISSSLGFSSESGMEAHPSVFTTAEFKSIEVEGSEIAYYEFGQGRPIVLLHGWPDKPSTFMHQVEVLTAAGYRVYCPFLPGYGPSSPPANGHFALYDLANILDGFIARVAPGQEVDLYGHDWGAALAELIEALHQGEGERGYSLRSVILGAVSMRAFGRVQRESDWLTRLRTRYAVRHFFWNQFDWHTSWALYWDLDYIRDIYRRWSPMMPADDPHITEVIDFLKQGQTYHNSLLYYRYTLNSSYQELVPEKTRQATQLLRQPPGHRMLVIYGSEDPLVSDTVRRKSREIYTQQGSRVVTIPRAGHFLHYDNSEDFNTELLKFLSE